MENQQKINTIVFFFINPIRASRRKSFQLERLEKEGNAVFIIDATKYFNNDMELASSKIHENTVECSREEDFIKFKKSLGTKKVLFVTSDRYIEVASPIFNLLIKKDDKLLTFKTKSFSDKDFTSNPFRKEIDNTIKILDKILPLHFLKYYYILRYKIFTPDYFLCSTEYLVPTKAYLTVKKANRIIVHADDINEVFYDKPSVINSKRKIGVFIDQGVPFLSITHPLVYPPGILPENYLETYYEEIGRTLKKIKDNLELDEIAISMHPSSIHFQNELKDILPGYTKFVWKTPELIKDSYVVITHSSTALSYAVYYKKPIILLENGILSGIEKFYRSIKFFKENLNLPSVFMDNDLSQIPKLHIDNKSYKNYTNKFLKDNQIQENSYYYAITKIINEVNAANS